MGDVIALYSMEAPNADDAEAVFSDSPTPIFTYSHKALPLSADNAVLITPEGGILFGKNEHTPCEMASTTKVMTALLVAEYLEAHSLDEKTKISKEAAATEGSSVYLEAGEEVRLIDLLYALMLESANDAAVALAEAVGGSLAAFVDMMNEKSQSLALDHTRFQNPHGLPAEDHYTTPYSLARLMAYAMDNPLFARITATGQYSMKTETFTRHLINHNRLLKSDCGVIGGKTGFTKRAGRCLVTVAEHEGARLIAVTLSAPDDWLDHKTLYEYGFSTVKAVDIPKECHPLAVISGNSTLNAISEAVTLTLPREFEALTFTRELPRFVYAPIAKGDRVGTITVSYQGKTLAKLMLTAETAVAEQKEKSVIEKLLDTLFQKDKK